MSRLLLVEDDPDVRPLLQHVLLSERYDVDAAATLAEGRRLMAERRYDLALIDAELPDGSGLDLAGEAKMAGIKVLIVTGYALRLPAKLVRQYEFVMKPLRPHELLSAVAAKLESC